MYEILYMYIFKYIYIRSYIYIYIFGFGSGFEQIEYYVNIMFPPGWTSSEIHGRRGEGR